MSKLTLVLAIGSLTFIGVAAAPSKDETLQVAEGQEQFILTVPVSKLTMHIPKSGLSEARNTHGGSANNPRYFYFQDKKEGVIVSGWFESESRFSSVKKVWEGDTKQWSRQACLRLRMFRSRKLEDGTLLSMTCRCLPEATRTFEHIGFGPAHGSTFISPLLLSFRLQTAERRCWRCSRAFGC